MSGSVAGTVHNRPLGSGYDAKVGLIESMEDTIGNRDGYNPITHSKVEWDCPLVPFRYRGSSTESYGSKLCEGESEGYASCGSAQVEYGKTASSLNFNDSDEDAIQRAVNNMQFGVQDAPFHAPTFLGELRELRDLYRQTIGAFKFRQGTKYSKRENFLQKIFGSSLKEGLRRMAISDLFNSFALQPFLADLENMRRSWGHAERQLKRLYGGQPVRVLGSVRDVVEAQHSFTTNAYQNTWGVYHSRARLITAYALVLYQPTGDQASRAQVGFDAFGFDQPVTTLWNLTPYSWLVDYLIKVGDWIEDLETDLIEIPYSILQSGYSVKKTLDSEAWVRFDNPNHYASPKLSTIESCPPVKGRRTETLYVRESGPLPIDSSLWPKLSIPSPRQARNVLDLVFLKVFK